MKNKWKGKNGKWLGLIMLILPFLFVFISLFIGKYPVSLGEVLAALRSIVPTSANAQTVEVSETIQTVVLQLRLPRAIEAGVVGACLAVSGAAFQGTFRNPLATSGLLGASNGAAFGAALSIVLFGTTYYTCGFAFVFGIIAVCCSYWIARVYQSVQGIMIILGGTIVSSLFSALLTLVKYVADVDSDLPAIVYWLMGSVSAASYKDAWLLIPALAGIVILCIKAWNINILSMGDREASSLGIEVNREKCVIIMAATLCTASAVCMAGVISWVGLIIPHIVRMIVGNDNRKLLPMSVSLGAMFMIVIDVISRSISSSEIPLGVLTAIVGAPFFVALLKKTKGGGWQE
jgi:iron complex transport system permease protein